MSFLLALLEYKSAIIFYSLIFLLVYLNRKKFDEHAKFIFLYRTKIGIRLMNFVASKATKLVRVLGYLGAVVGFAGMFAIFILILSLTYKLVIGETKGVGASPVIPGLPIAGTGLVFPLVTGWIVLFMIILVHEFSHGIVASAHKIKIKNSGIAFFGPILGAFVEPDEKKLAKRKDMVQYSVFAAGAFANFLTVVMVVFMAYLVLSPLNNLLTNPTGVIVFSQPDKPAEKSGIKNNTVITAINTNKVLTAEDFRKAMDGIKAGENVKVIAGDKLYTVATIETPNNPKQGYLGVWIIEEKREIKNNNLLNNALLKLLEWFGEMFSWLAFLSLNIGLINLLPIFITDGARMLKVLFERIIKNKEKSISLWMFFNWVSLLSLLILVFLPLFRWLGVSLISLVA